MTNGNRKRVPQQFGTYTREETKSDEQKTFYNVFRAILKYSISSPISPPAYSPPADKPTIYLRSGLCGVFYMCRISLLYSAREKYGV